MFFFFKTKTERIFLEIMNFLDLLFYLSEVFFFSQTVFFRAFEKCLSSKLDFFWRKSWFAAAL